MIYAKIYLKVEGNETYIITESAIKNVDEKYCMLTGEHITEYGDPYEISKTRILSAHNVAISIEAKDMFLKLLAFDNENKEPGIFNDDFVFEEYRNTKGEIDGEFAFLPDKGSINKKVFNVKKTIIINSSIKIRINIFHTFPI